MLASEQFGLADRALELTVAYVRERRQFARPVGGFQAIKHRLADLWVAVSQARAVARAAADRLSQQNEAETELTVALAKAACSDTALKAAQEMVQLHGGIGFTWEHPAHLFLKRAKADSHRRSAPPTLTGRRWRGWRTCPPRRPEPEPDQTMKDVAGAGVVVTGGGSGIGAALARRFAAEGARVVVNDIDGAAAAAVAGECGPARWPCPAMRRARPELLALIGAARSALGEIDLYCANAGIARAGGPEATESDWEDSWQVNVMAHVRAARLLLPPWLERGSGHLICTVSAAGLLAMPGAAPYTVTKHAALSFAEWLGFTYAHRGITVQAICPLGVRTPMLPADGSASKLLGDAAIEPEAVAAAVIAGLADGRFLILPHPEVAGMYAGRAADPDRWREGMSQIQQFLEAP